MTRMYDSIHVDAIPADATEVLAYTDGEYANVDTLRARFPNARLHTISAVGAVVGEWIDVEVGCVWPPNRAVYLWHSWRNHGCRGFYCSISLQPTIRGLLAPGDSPEWFDANYTGVDHVDPGFEATQYADPGPYDITETTPAFEGEPTAPSIIARRNNDMPIIVSDGQHQWLVASDLSRKHQIADPSEGSQYASALGQTVVPVDADLCASVPTVG